MSNKKDLNKQFIKGGEIEHKGAVKDVMNKFNDRTLKSQAGHTIINPKEALMDAFNQACKSSKRLLNENGKKGINISDLPDKIFRNI